jgi:hypothetical protein
VKRLCKGTIAVVIVAASLFGSMGALGAAAQTAGVFPAGGQFLGVSSDSTCDAWAVGTYWNPRVGSEPLVGHWNGGIWSNVRASLSEAQF